jgi:heptosyltransferase-2
VILRREAEIDLAGVRRLLLRLPNWLGDLCFAAPAVEALAEAAPEADFVVVGKRSLLPLAKRFPRVVRSIAVEKPREGVRVTDAVRRMRASGCDAAVVFPRSFRAALGPALARIPTRVGFASEARALLLTHPVRGVAALRTRHRTEYFGSLLRPFGMDPPDRPWRFRPTGEYLLDGLSALEEAAGKRVREPYAVFEPGGAYGTAKRWPPARFAALARRIVSEGHGRVLLVGSSDMRPLAAEIRALAGVPVLDLAGATTLVDLAGILAHASVVVSNDTGPLHLAAAIGVPVVALYGSTDPAVCGPRGEGPIRVFYDRVECSPCWLRECPVPGHPCLDPLDADRVFEAVVGWMAPRA